MADLNLDSGKVYFDSRQNYQKIIIEGQQNVSVGGSASRQLVSVPHNLGRHPAVRVWYLNGDGDICETTGGDISFVYVFETSTFENHICYYYIYSDRVDIYFDRMVNTGPTINSTVYWRIYGDDA